MKIQYFNGGLANQLFQYIFMRFVEIQTNEPCYLDDMKFFKVKEHNGYELERIFGVKPKLLSNFFSPDVWQYMVERALRGEGDTCQQIQDSGENIFMVAETSNYNFNGNLIHIPANKFIPEIVNTQGNVYYHGYWINRNWLNSYRGLFLKELAFPAITDQKNIIYQNAILKEESVAVHIRRGDYVNLGWNLKEDFYCQAMKTMAENCDNGYYFIFSDDPEWCKNHYKELGLDYAKNKIEFVEGNVEGLNYIDMQLMSLCKNIILSNSAFSYYAALMNQNPNALYINPVPFREI